MQKDPMRKVIFVSKLRQFEKISQIKQFLGTNEKSLTFVLAVWVIILMGITRLLVLVTFNAIRQNKCDKNQRKFWSPKWHHSENTTKIGPTQVQVRRTHDSTC